MLCHGCHRISATQLCRECFGGLTPAPDRVVGDARAIAAFDHTGVAAGLVHDLKYRGDDLIVRLVALELSPRLPRGAVYVPVPRVWSRYLRYGVDPAATVAGALASVSGGSVRPILARPIHQPRRAGSGHRGRAGKLRSRSGLQGRVIVVDDVLTTGATVVEAMRALLPAPTALVVCATSARQVSSLFASGADSHLRGVSRASGRYWENFE